MITKELKKFRFEYNEETKMLELVFQPEGINESIVFTLPKTQMISLERFIIRVMARLSTKRRKTKTGDIYSTDGSPSSSK